MPEHDRQGFYFGDLGSQLYGLARFDGEKLVDLVVIAGETGVEHGSDGGQLESSGGDGWSLAVPGLLELRYDPLGEPARFADGEVSQLCAVTGEIQRDGAAAAISCLGQRSADPASPSAGQRRAIDAWLAQDLGLCARSLRTDGAPGHEADRVEAVVLEGSPPAALRADEPRLSTIYGPDGLPRRAGLELWMSTDDDYPRRAAGERLAGQRLPDGSAYAFMRWHIDGREGVGCYRLSAAGA